MSDIHESILTWYDAAARDLPWRGHSSPWAVMVSEFMLQQTPVSRVLPVFEAWIERWPTPADLAAEPVGEAIKAWGRLGYPRRALRLHATAVAITEAGGKIADTEEELRKLPGVGEYTAAAIVSFAFGKRALVLDTNVRRVFARLMDGTQHPAKSLTAAERAVGESLLPDDATTAAQWAAATMELGALICTARSPECGQCPVSDQCRWLSLGRPTHEGAPRRGQSWHGTDRQCRGKLMTLVRNADDPVPKDQLDLVWSDDSQRERCIDSLLDDGLLDLTSNGEFILPV